MSRHRITIEVDTDRSVYGTDWEAEHDQPALLPEDIPAYAETFGAGPGAQWDQVPMTRVVSVEEVVG
jgi:hypothetical protein